MNKKYFSLGLVLAIIFASASLIGCRKGEKGDPGPSSSGNNLAKEGFISGTMEGYKSDDVTYFNLPFKYEYIKSPSDNILTIDSNGDRNYSITRYDSTGNSFIKFEFYIQTYAGQNGPVTAAYGEYATVQSFIKESNTATFYFGTMSTEGDPFVATPVSIQNDFTNVTELLFTNVVVNPTTGKVTFDYSLSLIGNDNSTGNTVTLTGSLSVNPPTFVYRTTTAE
jgi:hypothetical protein